MRGCDLCGVRARIHCNADQASLCWDCDEKVHGANFLVAKHPRSLLCHGCQSPTPWSGSGPKLTPTVSVCLICVERRGTKSDRREIEESEADNDDDDDGDEEDDDDDGDEEDSDDDDDDDDDDDEEEEDCDDDEEDENQVVPWNCCSYAAAEAPPAASCSSSDEEGEAVSVSVSVSVSKRMRENADLDFDGAASDSGSLRQLKLGRLGGENRLPSRRSTAILSPMRRLRNQTGGSNGGDDRASATVFGICELSREDHSRLS